MCSVIVPNIFHFCNNILNSNFNTTMYYLILSHELFIILLMLFFSVLTYRLWTMATINNTVPPWQPLPLKTTRRRRHMSLTWPMRMTRHRQNVKKPKRRPPASKRRNRYRSRWYIRKRFKDIKGTQFRWFSLHQQISHRRPLISHLSLFAAITNLMSSMTKATG